jgi:hypothetical protein
MQRAATGRRCTLQRARAPLPRRRRLCSGPLQGGLSGEVLRRRDASPALMRPSRPRGASAAAHRRRRTARHGLACGLRGAQRGRTSSKSAPCALTLTVWISLWRAQMILPLASMDATGSSRPILISTVPSS